MTNEVKRTASYTNKQSKYFVEFRLTVTTEMVRNATTKFKVRKLTRLSGQD